MQVAHRYADLASTAVAVVVQVHGPRTGLRSPHLIGMAQRMVMLR